MNCPVCDEHLRPVEKYGVEVDICPGCKGVWLDRGELDKILDMASAGGPALNRGFERERDTRSFDQPGDSYRNREDERKYREQERDSYNPRARDEHYSQSRHKRRGGWLGEILEGFGGGDD